MYDNIEDQLNVMRMLQDVGLYYAAIPDVHGEIDELERVLAGVEAWRKHNKVDKKDLRYVFLGDYIDRGPEPTKVIAKVREYVEDHDAICLMGNHDAFLVGTGDMSIVKFNERKYAYNSYLWSINNGHRTCVQMFGAPSPESMHIPIENGIPNGPEVNIYRDKILASEEYKFLKENAKLYFETHGLFFCHAPQSSMDFDNTSLIWGHASDYGNQKGDACFITPNNKMMSIHGHFHRLSQGINFPRIHNYMHGGLPKQVVLADCGCGCGFGGRLMSVIVKEFDVSAKRAPRIVAII